MSDFNLEDFEEENSTEYDFQKVMKILEVVASKKATYSKEVSGTTGIDRKTVSKILHKLHEKDYLERLNPSIKNSDRRLLDRVDDMWTNNMKGIDQFRNAKWYALNSEHDWILKVDSNNPDDPDYVNEFHIAVNDVPDKKASEFVAENLRMVS